MQNIVADMRKVLAKNPQVEQQRLHRRVFLDDIDPENQALMVGPFSFHVDFYIFFLELAQNNIIAGCADFILVP